MSTCNWDNIAIPSLLQTFSSFHYIGFDNIWMPCHSRDIFHAFMFTIMRLLCWQCTHFIAFPADKQARRQVCMITSMLTMKMSSGSGFQANNWLSIIVIRCRYVVSALNRHRGCQSLSFCCHHCHCWHSSFSSWLKQPLWCSSWLLIFIIVMTRW